MAGAKHMKPASAAPSTGPGSVGFAQTPPDPSTPNYAQSSSGYAGYDQEPLGSAQAPSGYDQEPYGSAQAPSGYEQEPYGNVQAPASYDQEPYGNVQAPASYDQEPLGSAQAPSGFAQEPIGFVQASSSPSGSPEASFGNDGFAQSPAGSAHATARSRSRLAQIAPYLVFILGIAMALYYPISEAWDAYRRGEIAKTLDLTSETVTDERKEELLAQATSYNLLLAGLTPEIPADQIWPYEDQLSYLEGRDTAFGYLKIPKIALTMPVYHGTTTNSLMAGVGHLDTSSLPIGGASTHAILSAHSGMEGMRAFDDIGRLSEGDVFGITVLGELRCYKVNSIEIVLPEETESFAIQAGRDLMTLVTCTPYGVNDHRLLVHAERCAVPDGFLDEPADIAAMVTSPHILAILACVVIALLLAIALVLIARRGKKRHAAKPLAA